MATARHAQRAGGDFAARSACDVWGRRRRAAAIARGYSRIDENRAGAMRATAAPPSTPPSDTHTKYAVRWAGSGRVSASRVWHSIASADERREMRERNWEYRIADFCEREYRTIRTITDATDPHHLALPKPSRRKRRNKGRQVQGKRNHPQQRSRHDVCRDVLGHTKQQR